MTDSLSISGQFTGFVPWNEDAPPPPTDVLLRRASLAACALLLLLFVLAVAIPIGGAVIGSGQVGVQSRVKRIAHPTGGVIAKIAVTNGQHVREGQLLMRLDDRVSSADEIYSGLTVEQLLAQRARLLAEQSGQPSISFPPELLNSRSVGARKAMADENSLFHMRHKELDQERAQLTARVAQYQQEIHGYEAQIGSLERQRGLIEPERQGVKQLWDKRLVTINRFNQLERTAVELDGSIGALTSQIAAARARITEAQEQFVQAGQQRRVDAGSELSKINTALNQQQLRSISASDQQDRSEIRASYSGTVEKIAFSAVGDVVRPAEPIMEIVPDRDVMIVEAAISPADIDQVVKGQKARVRFSAFNRAATPEVGGIVTYVAMDTSEKAELRSAFYVVRIAVNQAAISREALNLRSGMPAEVYIETGSRSLISYVLKPLRDQFNRAFRDN